MDFYAACQGCCRGVLPGPESIQCQVGDSTKFTGGEKHQMDPAGDNHHLAAALVRAVRYRLRRCVLVDRQIPASQKTCACPARTLLPLTSTVTPRDLH